MVWQLYPIYLLYDILSGYLWFILYEYLKRVHLWHDDVIKWKLFPRCWPLVRGIHRSPVNSPHKGQWRGALMYPFICAWINGWVNNHGADEMRRHRAHYDVIVMVIGYEMFLPWHARSDTAWRYMIWHAHTLMAIKHFRLEKNMNFENQECETVYWEMMSAVLSKNKHQP